MSIDAMYEELLKVYRPDEFPALAEQIREWRISRPLAGKKIFDATPVFRNTMMKYVALLAAGAELTVGRGRGIPCDPATVERLRTFGIRVADAAALGETYAVVLDCAGANADVKSESGYVELTRSGMYRYRDCAQPVFLADEGRIKEIETALGTGDGFRRGMARFGFGDFSRRNIVVFGCGKVGSGIVMYATGGGARVTVIDDASRMKPPFGAAIVDLHDRDGINRAVRDAWCVVSATGIRGALAGKFDLAALAAGHALIANMGVEDEFGPEIPAKRVLNAKEPLNFALEEPTHMKYIDPTLALDNYGAAELLAGTLAPGLNHPPKRLEEKILNTVRAHGAVAPELAKLEAGR